MITHFPSRTLLHIHTVSYFLLAMPVLTRSKETLAQAFKTPSLPSNDMTAQCRLYPTPTSLSLSSGKKSGKRARLLSTSSTTSTLSTASSSASSTTSSASSTLSMIKSTGDSWRGRSAVTGAQKRFPRRLGPDPNSVAQFMQGIPESGILSFHPTTQLDYLVDLEKRSRVELQNVRFTAKCAVKRVHFELMLRMVLMTSPGECPMNTALTAYFLLCRYLNEDKRMRVAGQAFQDALLVACCLIAFKLVEEVDLGVDEVIAQCHLCCSQRQVLKMERRLCVVLEWKLMGPPTPEEAAHAVLDSLDTNSCLGYACKALLVQCCVDVISDCIFENGHTFSMVGMSAVCLQALFSAFSGRILNPSQVWDALNTRYSIDNIPPPNVYNKFMKKFKSFRK